METSQMLCLAYLYLYVGPTGDTKDCQSRPGIGWGSSRGVNNHHRSQSWRVWGKYFPPRCWLFCGSAGPGGRDVCLLWCWPYIRGGRQISLKWGTWEPGSQALLVLPGTFSEKNTKLAPLNRPLELPGTFNGKCFKLIKCACWTFQKCLAECGRYENKNNKCMCLLAYSICDADHVPDD